MEAVISRKYEATQTPGCLYVFDKGSLIINLKTLELPNKDNAKNVSCILPGSYWVTKITSVKHGKCFLLHDVPGRSAVEIHSGNFASGVKVDTEGCILPGFKFIDINNDGYLDVSDSKIAMVVLWAILPNKFKLTIL